MNKTEKEKSMAIRVLQIITHKGLNPIVKLYPVFNGDLQKAISLIDNPEVLYKAGEELKNLQNQINNAINKVKYLAKGKAINLEKESKRFDSMSREDLIAHIKELEK